MRSRVKNIVACLLSCVALAGCAGGGGPSAPVSSPTSGSIVSDLPVIVGAPYTIAGRSYTPSNPEHYDEVGNASFYGEELAGRPTANGEAFYPAGISAAHRTLPLPSYVEVTSLDTGQTILVRINDRGPFSPDKVIDLSVGAARLLGIERQGVVPVRVRRVYPAEADKARLRSGQSAPSQLTASDQLLRALRARMADGGGIIPPAAPPEGASGRIDRVQVPAPAETARPPTAPSASAASTPPRSAPATTGHYFVQLGAFSNAGNARRLADRVRSLGSVRIVDGGGLNRVRLGPYTDSRSAQAALDSARAAGLSDARIFRDPPR